MFERTEVSAAFNPDITSFGAAATDLTRAVSVLRAFGGRREAILVPDIDPETTGAAVVAAELWALAAWRRYGDPGDLIHPTRFGQSATGVLAAAIVAACEGKVTTRRYSDQAASDVEDLLGRCDRWVQGWDVDPDVVWARAAAILSSQADEIFAPIAETIDVWRDELTEAS